MTTVVLGQAHCECTSSTSSSSAFQHRSWITFRVCVQQSRHWLGLQHQTGSSLQPLFLRKSGRASFPFLITAQEMSGQSPLHIMISGAPASGKGTQCELIVQKFGVNHISTGDLLRAEVAEGTTKGIKAKDYVSKGLLVPDEIVTEIVKDKLAEAKSQGKGWLMDGYPRTAPQAEALKALGITPDVFIILDVPDDVLIERVVGRRLDPVMGKIYHLKYSPPENEEVAARLIQRIDDTEPKARLRLQAYAQNVEALTSHYMACMKKINGDRPKLEVFEDISKILDDILEEKLQTADALETVQYLSEARVTTGFKKDKWRGVPTKLNSIPHSREIRDYFYEDVCAATKRAVEDGIHKLKVEIKIPELNPEMDVYRAGTLLELTRELAFTFANDGKRVKVCVQGSMGEGIFSGMPLQLAGARRMLEQMDWGAYEVKGTFINVGSIGRNEVSQEDDIFILMAPQNAIGNCIIDDLQAMVNAAGDRAVIIVNPRLKGTRTGPPPFMDSDIGKISVGGIAWDTSKERLKEYFSGYGEVVDVAIVKDKASGRSRGFGFVAFADPGVVDSVLQEKHTIQGRLVECKKAVPRDEQQNLPRHNSSFLVHGVLNRTKKIFVGGLASTLTEEQFRDYFTQFGTITDAVVMYDHDTQRPRGFGFITFESEDSVEKVVQKPFYELHNKTVEVKKAIPREHSVGAGGRTGQYGEVFSFSSGRGTPPLSAGYGQMNNTSLGSAYGGARYMPSPGCRSFPHYGLLSFDDAGYAAPRYGLTMNGAYAPAPYRAMPGYAPIGGFASGYGPLAPASYGGAGAYGATGPPSQGYVSSSIAPPRLWAGSGVAGSTSPAAYGAGGTPAMPIYGSPGWTPSSGGGQVAAGYNAGGYGYGAADPNYSGNTATGQSVRNTSGAPARYGEVYTSPKPYGETSWRPSSGGQGMVTYMAGYGMTGRQNQGPDACFRPYPTGSEHAV